VFAYNSVFHCSVSVLEVGRESCVKSPWWFVDVVKLLLYAWTVEYACLLGTLRILPVIAATWILILILLNGILPSGIIHIGRTVCVIREIGPLGGRVVKFRLRPYVRSLQIPPFRWIIFVRAAVNFLSFQRILLNIVLVPKVSWRRLYENIVSVSTS